MSWVKLHKIFHREDGAVHQDERHVTASYFMDKIFPWALMGLIGWLCLAMMSVQSNVAVLVDRSTTQSKTLDRLSSDMDGAKVNESYMQHEIDGMKAGH